MVGAATLRETFEADPADHNGAARPRRRGRSSRLVMVIEDDPMVGTLMREVIEVYGFETIGVSDGVGVTDLVAAHAPDVITLDLSLPDRSGNDVLLDLAIDPRTRDIPVVVVSATVELLRMSEQVRAVLRKPFDLHELVGVLQACTARPILH